MTAGVAEHVAGDRLGVGRPARALALAIARAPRAGLEQIKRSVTERCLAASDAAMARELEPHLASRGQAETAVLADTTYGRLAVAAEPAGERS
jgi:hypothetical protein